MSFSFEFLSTPPDERLPPPIVTSQGYSPPEFEGLPHPLADGFTPWRLFLSPTLKVCTSDSSIPRPPDPGKIAPLFFRPSYLLPEALGRPRVAFGRSPGSRFSLWDVGSVDKDPS